MIPLVCEDAIRHFVTTPDVAERYGLIQSRREQRVECPFCGSEKKTLRLYHSSKGYYCRRCREGGDVILFVQRYFDINRDAACRKINDDFELNLDVEWHKMQRKRKPENKIRCDAADEKRKDAQKEKLLYCKFWSANDRIAFLTMVKEESEEGECYYHAHINSAIEEFNIAYRDLAQYENEKGAK